MCLKIFEAVAGVHFVHDSLFRLILAVTLSPLSFPLDVAMSLICGSQSVIIEVRVQP